MNSMKVISTAEHQSVLQNLPNVYRLHIRWKHLQCYRPIEPLAKILAGSP